MSQNHYILGISAYYHDSAAALLRNGEIIAAAQEERFTRKKHDSGFPSNAIKYCLSDSDIELTDVSELIFYDKPLIKFERLLETYLTYAPRGIRSFAAAMPVWLKEKLLLKETLKREFCAIANCGKNDLPDLLFSEHHRSHAASAFFPSPYKSAAILCLDGVGEWATTSLWHGKNNHIDSLWQINFPHSLGLLYSAFTYFCGFRVNSGEYKLMGLAPYGEPKYVDLILNNLIDIKEDGTFRLAMRYFGYCTGLRMTNSKFDSLFGGPPRQSESELTQREMDIAASIQKVTELVVLRLVSTAHKETRESNICLAGGVALNCVANGRILRESPFESVWIQPAAGDAGGAIGAAQVAWHERRGEPRRIKKPDGMNGAFLGPKYDQNSIRKFLVAQGADFRELGEAQLTAEIAKILAGGNVVGLFQGRMEFGPRALGGRSIIGDARDASMQSTMNLKIKYRESFRPFAPSVLAERVSDYFDLEDSSPYMLIVANISEHHRKKQDSAAQSAFGIQKLKIERSTLPAITHVDYSARIQTVHQDTNPRYYNILKAFEEETGCAVLVNTSFNVRGEPIVCSPHDAYQCFMRTEMDYLVLENFLLPKQSQPEFTKSGDWKEEIELD